MNSAANPQTRLVFDEAALERIKRGVMFAALLWIALRVVVFLVYLPALRWGEHDRVLLADHLTKEFEGLHVKDLSIKSTAFHLTGGFFDFSEDGRTIITADVLADDNGRERLLYVEGLIVHLYGGKRVFGVSVHFD